MRISEECEHCLRRLSHQAAAFAAEDESIKRAAMDRAEQILHDRFKPGEVSIVIASAMHEAIKQVTKNPDPYRKMKDVEIETAGRLFDIVKGSYHENLRDYLKLAALGNAIDFFRPLEIVEKEICRHNVQFVIDDWQLLEEKVKIFLFHPVSGGQFRRSVFRRAAVEVDAEIFTRSIRY